jgi:uncharacterized protein (DUF305 family)
LTPFAGKDRLIGVKLFARAALVCALAVTGTAGCAGSGNDPATAPATTAATRFGGTDLAWIEINIAMDEQLLPLLDLVPQRSGSPAVQALAQQVKAFTTDELATLRALHDQAGLPSVNPHEGMPMPGMVTPDDVAAAAKQTGKPFDATVVKSIKAHLDQSQNLAGSEDKSGVEPQTRALALQVRRTREAALSTLREIKQ